MKRIIVLTIAALIFISCKQSYNGELLYMQSMPEKGFNFPYLLFLPEDMPRDQELTLIVEPNNTGMVTDDFKKHIEKAQRQATRPFYTGNFLANELKNPLLVPIFPRSRKESRVYTHSLDRDVMLKKKPPLQRIDLQLLAMKENALDTLRRRGFRVREKFFMTGFSASGTFANRFSLIHPEKLLGVAAGGLNGILMLPNDTLHEQALIYPIGIADFDSIFNKPFNAEKFKSLPQFLFMGEMDDNDAAPYSDAYGEKERRLIYNLPGKTMLPERWDRCKEIYKSHSTNATMKTYENVGHENTARIKNDVLHFFTKLIANESQ